MQNLVRAAFVALVSAVAVPASAALIQYDFTAGGAGAYSEEYLYNYATGQYVSNANNFSLSARFIVDTSKMTQASGQQVSPGIQSYFDNYNGGESFMSATATKTGGTLPLPNSSIDARAYFNAYVYAGAYEQFNLHAGTETSSQPGYVEEYHANGVLARQSYLSQYIAMGFYNNSDIFDFGIVDGVQVVTALRSLQNAYLQVGEYSYEFTYDQFGNQTGYSDRQTYSFAYLTSANIGPVTTDVPEPAALSLLGLGVLGLALRRRKAA